LVEAERRLVNALDRRSARLLALLRDRVYPRPTSPYLALLRHAGVTPEDIEALVDREGVEGALAQLAAVGVYVSLDEFKGRRPIRRGSFELAVRPDAFDHRLPGTGFGVRSGATRSAGTPTLLSLDVLTEEATYQAVQLSATGYSEAAVAVWYPIPPGVAGIAQTLILVKLGRPPDRWFSQVPVSLTRSQSSAWMTWGFVRLLRLYGVNLPMPEYVPLDHAERVTEWVSARRNEGVCCHVITYVSSAVRACAGASSRLDGVLFHVSSEPLTPSRAATIQATGADVTNLYAMAEVGQIAVGCGDPMTPDDVHLLLDRVALVQQPREVADGLVDAFLLTALSPYAPKLMLNVEVGDTGRLSDRRCSCRFDALGFHRHIDQVTSYEKLTSEGMTYDARELARVIEEVFPARFGGAATDYQALEEVGDDGFARLSIVISPRLGAIAEADVLAALRAELQRGPAGHRLADLVWGQTDFLRIRRDEPVKTVRGKLLPFHSVRSISG
jgi:hypothetical protein